MTRPDLTSLPDIKLEGDEPVFNEPWETQAFAMVISLHRKGAFTWNEWTDALSAEIHSGSKKNYYAHWLDALEKLVASKKISSLAELKTREKAWHDAAARTPHGEAIEL